MQTLRNVSLAKLTSLHTGGAARLLVKREPSDRLQEIIISASKPVWLLGHGTNVLISDAGLDGTVVLNATGKLEVLGNGKIRCESGASWDELVQKAVAHNLWGLEFASGIPGGIGAALAGNIAAYGHKVADSLVEATMLDSRDGSIHIWRNEDFGFGYRSSVLQKTENQHMVVIDATFQLSATPTGELEYQSALKTAEELQLAPDTLENRRRIILETRRKAGSLLTDLQTGPWTAGSFFKNPVANPEQVEAIIAHEEFSIDSKQLLRQNIIHGGTSSRVSAAHVLLAAGFQRGESWGQVRLHPDHILKVENIGQATAQEIYDVVRHIIETVQQKLGITLEPEVRFLGNFR